MTRLALLVGVVLALAPSANAATRCVLPASGCDSSHATINDAVTAADPGDVIRLGAATYDESVIADEPVHFEGEGAGTLDSPGTTIVRGLPAFRLTGGGSIRSIRAVGADAAAGSAGIELAPSANGNYEYSIFDVVGIGGNATSSGMKTGDGLRLVAGAGRFVALTLMGGGFRPGVPNGGPTSSAMELDGPDTTASMTGTELRGLDTQRGLHVVEATATLAVSRASGFFAARVLDGALDVHRSRLEAIGNGDPSRVVALLVSDSPDGAASKATATDSLLTATATAATEDVSAGSVESGLASQSATLEARGSTFIARGPDPESGIMAAQASMGTAVADLRNSIAHIEGEVEPDEGDLVALNGTITASHSSFRSTHATGSGSATEPGSGTNVAGDPLLAADLSLLPGSPLVDRGDQAIVAPDQLDLAGAPRSLDGNGDCVPAPDIGAFERPSTCSLPASIANVPPRLLAVSMLRRVFAPTRASGRISQRPRRVRRGTRFRYTLSEAARVQIRIERALAGRRRGRRCVRLNRRNRRARRCTRYRRVTTLRQNKAAGRQQTPFTGRVRRRALRPGRYRARISAVDAQGARSAERRIAFRIVRG